MKAMYTAEATAQAGRQGHVQSDDNFLNLDLAMPKAMGGTGQGTNPEQLFAGGYAACFHSALLFIAQQGKVNAEGSTVTARVAIGQDEGTPGFKLGVELMIDLPNLAEDEARSLVDQAHGMCPYSNAIRGNVDVELVVKPGQ